MSNEYLMVCPDGKIELIPSDKIRASNLIPGCYVRTFYGDWFLVTGTDSSDRRSEEVKGELPALLKSIDLLYPY